MKLKTKLMLFTAATALSANVAFAAINPQALADAYVAEGYTYVEVKVGPTQTKLEAVKGDRKVEVIYDNASEAIIKQEFGDADDDYVGRTGVEIEDTASDFEDSSDDENDDENDDDGDDDESDDDEDDGDDDSSDDDEGDDNDGGDDESDDESDGDSDGDSDDTDDEDSSGGDDGDDGDED
jgi:hypothetical protein